MKLTSASFPKVSNGVQLLELVQTPLADLTAIFLKAYNNGDLNGIRESLTPIREALSQDNDKEPPIKELMQENIVAELLHLLKPEFSHEEEIISEVLWITINIASFDPQYSATLVKFGIVGKAVEFLQHPSDTIREHAVWLLTNITGDFLDERDNLLDMGIVQKIQNMFNQSVMPESLQVNTLWFISNLCRGEPHPSFNRIAPFLPYIQHYLGNSTNSNILVNCMWALSYITTCEEDSEERIEAVLDMGKTKEILAVLKNGDPSVCAPAIRTIGNLINGDASQVDRVLEAGAIEALFPMLFHEVNKIKQETCWAFSNLLASKVEHLDQVLTHDNGNIIKRLMELFRSGPQNISGECFYALTNACEIAYLEEIATLVDFQIIEFLVDHIKQAPPPDRMEITLLALKRILEAGQLIKPRDLPSEANPYFQRLNQCGGLYVLERANFIKYGDQNVINLVEEILHAFNQ